jgi:polysaccharide pyruvyl transferase WcaK-like protein
MIGALLGKQVGIFGTGSGPDSSRFANFLVSTLCRLSGPLHIRDAQSIASLRSAGVKRNISLCVDLAHAVLHKGRYKTIFKKIQRNKEKLIIIHADAFFLNGMSDVPHAGLLQIMTKQKSLMRSRIVLLFDYLKEADLAPWKAEFRNLNVAVDLNIQEILKLLWEADAIISGKFHVALIGFTLGKPVYSFARHAKVRDLFDKLEISEWYFGGKFNVLDLERLMVTAENAKWNPKHERMRCAVEGEACKLYEAVVDFIRCTD